MFKKYKVLVSSSECLQSSGDLRRRRKHPPQLQPRAVRSGADCGGSSVAFFIIGLSVHLTPARPRDAAPSPREACPVPELLQLHAVGTGTGTGTKQNFLFVKFHSVIFALIDPPR